MKIDAVMLTKNSNTAIFEGVLKCLYREVDVNRLILIDGGSADGTIEVATKYPNVEVHFDIGGTRGTSRELGINLVETEYFLFIDSDVLLCKNWLRKAESLIKDEVGAVQGKEYPLGQSEIVDYAYAMEKLGSLLRGRRRALLPPLKGAFTGDVLIRTHVVRDIKIPSAYHIFEDMYIRNYVERKGYKWIVTDKPSCWCYHYTRKRMPSDSFYYSHLTAKVGSVSLGRVLNASIRLYPQLLCALILRPNLKMAKFQLLLNWYGLSGYIKGLLHREEEDVFKELREKWV